MSNTRYLEFTSWTRDRKEYPLPSDFVIEISQSGQKPRNQSKDPISNATPELYWNNSFRESTSSIITTALAVSLTASDRTILSVNTTAGGIRTIDRFYNGAIFTITVGSTIIQRRIIDYVYIGQSTTDYAKITLDRALPDGVITNDGTISNPTPFDTRSGTNPLIFIPAGSDIDNFYVGYVMQENTSVGITSGATVIAYDGFTHLATLSNVTTANWALGTINLLIRKERSQDVGTLLAVSASGSVLQLGLGTSIGPSLNTAFVRMLEPIPTSSFSTDVAPYGETRRIVKYITETGLFARDQASGDSVFRFTNSASSVDRFYVGSFVTVSGNTREILTYDGETRTGTISGTWGTGITANTTEWNIRSVFLESSFSTNPVIGGADLYEILQFSRDNWTPFAYNGSIVSSQQSVCYEVELINIILPNSLLVSGGRVAFYPFLYLQLENESSATNRSNTLIYSNNPNSNRMMFRVPIDDTPTPLISPFIKIDGDGMVQTVKFKPNDSFRMSIHLPTGQLFRTVTEDTQSPKEPNPLVQISALFSFKKV